MRRRTRWIAGATVLAAATVPAAVTASAAPVTPKSGPTLSVTLQLAPADPAGLRALAQAKGLSGSARQQRMAAVRPSAAAATRVRTLAAGEGLEVTGSTPFSVQVSGPASVVNKVFGNSLAGGKRQGLTVPATMRGLVVAAVGGADTLPAWKHHFTPTVVTGPIARSVYNSQPGTPANGSQQTIATIQFSGWDNTAFRRFATRVGLPNPLLNGIYTEISIDNANPRTLDGTGGDGEVALDQESIYATAPNAKQRAYFAPNSFASEVNAINRIAADALQTAPNLHITTLSISWGACELAIPAATRTALSTAFANLTAAGVTTFVSSGDFGPYDCADPDLGTDTSLLSVDYPASDPSVVGVGGTTLDATALNAPAEQTWWDPCTTALPCPGLSPTFRGFGGGAGTSAVFPKPAYQAGVLPAITTGRIVPDISAAANPESGFVVNLGPLGSPLLQFGGTSLAAPLSAAGFTNLLAGGGFNNGIGDIHPLLYQRAPARAFRDITTGVIGPFAAAAGFDRATGLGAPQWGQLANLIYPAVPGTNYVPVTPCRVFDTRTANAGTCPGALGYTAGAVGAGGTRTFTIGGSGAASGVPADATAVVINVTGVSPTATTNVTVFPTGATRPNTSNLNLVGGQPATPNLVTVKLGSNGQVSLFNAAGTIHLVGDLAGYYTPSAGATYTTVPPCRVFDTRPGTTATCPNAPTVAKAKVAAGTPLSVPFGSVVPAGATAVVLNVTGVNPVNGQAVSVVPGGASPTTSNLNFASGAKPRSNLVIVPVGANGNVDFSTSRGTIDLVADLAGYFSTAAGGTQFHAITPCRAFDTRNGLGTCVGALRVGNTPYGTNVTRSVLMAGPNAVPDGAKALVLNVTAVGATQDGFVTVFPSPLAVPGVSNINTVAGAGPTPNLVVVPVGTDRRVSFFNRRGSTHLIADVLGYYL